MGAEMEAYLWLHMVILAGACAVSAVSAYWRGVLRG